MEIYLLRHGSAEPAPPGGQDPERPLSPEGQHEIRRVVSAAKLAHACPSLILTSPYRRAHETARIAADLLDCRQQILSAEALTPDAKPEAVWEEIRVHRDEPSLLLAGHEPLFSACTAYLLASPELHVHFPKGGLVRIDVGEFGARPRGVLQWMLTPHLAL